MGMKPISKVSRWFQLLILEKLIKNIQQIYIFIFILKSISKLIFPSSIPIIMNYKYYKLYITL